MPTVKFLDLYENYKTMKDEIDASVQGVIDRTQFINGPDVGLFESEFAEFIGTKHCVGVGNGTDALEIGIASLELPSGSEIITQPNTFIATVLGISYNNLTPVFVDIDPNTMMIDHTKIEASITSKTKALCIVHLYGCSPNMDAIMDIVKKYDLILIEDCAQAHGALYSGRRLGTFGKISCFSFYPGKNLGCFGDGGAICTSDDAIHSKMMLLRNLGSERKYYHDVIGRNSRLDTIQAAVLRVKLRNLDNNNQKRRVLSNKYLEFLKDTPGIILPTVQPECTPVWHLFVIRVKDGNRENLQQFLKTKGVDTIIHYPIPVHKQEAYRDYNSEVHAICEEVSSEIVSLPMYPELSLDSVTYVCDCIKEFVQSH
jgi:dTDP-4-amino-4,6-dideoxygalactose transaminase